MEAKEYVLNKMQNIGLRVATALQEIASTLDGTALIEREGDIPDFNPDKHQYLDWAAGQVVLDEGQVWKLIQPYDSSIYKTHPNDLRAHWSLMHTKDPYKAKPFVPAQGTSGMYMLDECYKSEEGIVFRSLIDNNIWTVEENPQAWEEVIFEESEV